MSAPAGGAGPPADGRPPERRGPGDAPGEGPSGPTGPRSILREPAFLRLWAATTASGLATWALPFVLGLAVVDGTLGAGDLGIVLATRTVGFVLALPVAGVLADRHGRAPVIRGACLASAVAAPLLALGLERSLLLMALAGALYGAGSGACRPGFQALVADVVDEARRQQANAAITLAVRSTVLLAPGLVALLSTLTSPATLIVGVAGLWVAAALLPPAGRARPAPATRPATVAGLAGEFGDGLREARRHPWFLAGLGALSVVIFAGYSATGVALPLVSRERYGGEAVLAAALTAYTAGALAGALLLARWRPRRAGWAALAGLATYALAPLSLGVAVEAWVVVGAYAVVGAGIELFNVPWFTAAQREVPPRLLARVSSLDFLVSYGLAPVGLAVIAPAIDAWGGGPVLVGCAVACLLAPALAAAVPSSRDFARPGPPRTAAPGGSLRPRRSRRSPR